MENKYSSILHSNDENLYDKGNNSLLSSDSNEKVNNYNSNKNLFLNSFNQENKVENLYDNFYNFLKNIYDFSIKCIYNYKEKNFDDLLNCNIQEKDDKNNNLIIQKEYDYEYLYKNIWFKNIDNKLKDLLLKFLEKYHFEIKIINLNSIFNSEIEGCFDNINKVIYLNSKEVMNRI